MLSTRSIVLESREGQRLHEKEKHTTHVSGTTSTYRNINILKNENLKSYFFESNKLNSEAPPLIRTRAPRWEPPEGLKFPKNEVLKIEQTKT